MFSFEHATRKCAENIGTVFIPVIRTGGHKGHVTVKYHTESGTAMEGHDFEGTQGEIEFEHGEMERVIAINIIDDATYEKQEYFTVCLDKVCCYLTPYLLFVKKIIIIKFHHYLAFLLVSLHRLCYFLIIFSNTNIIFPKYLLVYLKLYSICFFLFSPFFPLLFF